jgi:hypothetical protein
MPKDLGDLLDRLELQDSTKAHLAQKLVSSGLRPDSRLEDFKSTMGEKYGLMLYNVIHQDIPRHCDRHVGKSHIQGTEVWILLRNGYNTHQIRAVVDTNCIFTLLIPRLMFDAIVENLDVHVWAVPVGAINWIPVKECCAAYVGPADRHQLSMEIYCDDTESLDRPALIGLSGLKLLGIQLDKIAPQ